MRRIVAEFKELLTGRVLLTLALVFVIVTALFFALKFHKTPFETQLPALFHYYFKFYPKYPYTACRFFVKIDKKEGYNSYDLSHVMGVFGNFLTSDEPEATGYRFSGRNGPDGYILEILFQDKCEEGPRIIKTGLKVAQRQNSFTFSMLLNESETRVRTILNERGWTDSKYYDPEYWRLRKSTYLSCNPKDWLKIATYDLGFDETDAAMVGSVYASYALELSKNDPEANEVLNKFIKKTGEDNLLKVKKLTSYAFERSSCR